MVFSCFTVLAQVEGSESTSEEMKNEIGIDATGFIKQYLSFGYSDYPQNYYPTYFMTYRRKFDAGNIRVGLGGDYQTRNILSPYAGDSNKYRTTSYSMIFRLGWEWKSNIGKRWQVYYGGDVRYVLNYDKNDAPFFNGGYANGYENKTKVYQVGPILGFRFKLNKRLSLRTESALYLSYVEQTGRNYYKAVNPGLPFLPDENTDPSFITSIGYAQPISVFFTFDF